MTGPQRDGLTLLAENGPAGAVSARGNGHGFISTRVARALVELGYASTTDEISYAITPAGLARHAAMTRAEHATIDAAREIARRGRSP